MLRRAFCLLLFSALVYGEKLNSTEQSVEDHCAIDGSGDFYGPGVRIGIYLVWLCSWLANNFLDEEIISTLETNSIFLLALFSTVYTLSLQDDAIRVIDVIVIHQLCTGFLFSIMSLWGYRTRYYKTEGPGGRRHFGHIGTHFRLALMTMVTTYGIWFWLVGVEGGLTNVDRREPCGGLITFFVIPLKVDAMGTRIFQLSLAFAYAIYYASMAVVAIVGVGYYVLQRVRGHKVTWQLIEAADAETDMTKRELTKWYIAISVFNLFWIIVSIVCVEQTLRLNYMQNVVWFTETSPGQIIPLLIGIFSFLRITYVIIHNRWEERKHKGNKMAGTGGYSNIVPMDDLGSTTIKPSASKHSTTSASRPTVKAAINLPHRVLLAWFPWLRLWMFFRRNFELPVISRPHSTVPIQNSRYEPMKPPTKQTQNVQPESPEARLLADTPQLHQHEAGLMAPSTRTSFDTTRPESINISDGPTPYDMEGYVSDGR